MLSFLAILLFGWFFFKVIGLTLRLAWGAAKIIAVVLTILALPALVCCLLFAGGVVLFSPLLLLGAAFAAIRAL